MGRPVLHTSNTCHIPRHCRMNIFDQIAAIGGTLGLFTGISIITFVEVIYWVFRFVMEMIRKGTRRAAVSGMITVITETEK